MKTIQIQNGLVLICGPSASGKTSLARKIYDMAPYNEKSLVSHDAMLKEYIKKSGFKQEMFYTGLDDSEDEKFKVSVIRRIRDSLQRHAFVIYESIYCDVDCLTQLIASFPTLGLDRPLTLLKMWLPLELNLQFATTHPERQAFRLDALLSQRAGFNGAIEPKYFASQAEWIREYVISDPRELNLEFKGAKEVTKELMAAYEIHEELLEKAPEIMRAMSEF